VRALLIINPRATAMTGRDAGLVVRALGSRLELDTRQTQYRGHAGELAAASASQGYDLVVTFSGDGTVNEVVNGLMQVPEGRPALAPIPGGGANVFARTLGLPADAGSAVQHILSAVAAGTRRKIGLGLAEDRYFTFSAGLGLDAQMLDDTSEPLKKRLGWFAYAISVVRHLGDRPMRVTVSADGDRRRRMRASTLIVGNVGQLRGGLPLLPDARPDDGVLDAVVLVARGLTGWLAVIANILLRRPAHGRMYRVQFTKLQVTLGQDEPWELDGEVMGSTRRLTVEAQPGGLLVRMPPESA